MPRAFAAGLDIRGHHGQILLPGSLHKSGGRYRWKDGHAPDQIELAELPGEWMRLVLNANKKTADGYNERPKSPRSTPPVRRASFKPSRPSSLSIGDGDGRGGFHGPINSILIRYFGKFGPDADAGRIKQVLRETIASAPSTNHQPQDIERYVSDSYLDEAVASARNYIKEIT